MIEPDQASKIVSIQAWKLRRIGVRLDEFELGPARYGEVPPGDSPDPARQLEAREALARFAQALEALPVAQREAFLLHEEAGLSIAEIAAATGSNAEAAKSRLRYAVGKLKAAVEDD